MAIDVAMLGITVFTHATGGVSSAKASVKVRPRCGCFDATTRFKACYQASSTTTTTITNTTTTTTAAAAPAAVLYLTPVLFRLLHDPPFPSQLQLVRMVRFARSARWLRGAKGLRSCRFLARLGHKWRRAAQPSRYRCKAALGLFLDAFLVLLRDRLGLGLGFYLSSYPLRLLPS